MAPSDYCRWRCTGSCRTKFKKRCSPCAPVWLQCCLSFLSKKIIEGNVRKEITGMHGKIKTTHKEVSHLVRRIHNGNNKAIWFPSGYRWLLHNKFELLSKLLDFLLILLPNHSCLDLMSLKRRGEVHRGDVRLCTQTSKKWCKRINWIIRAYSSTLDNRMEEVSAEPLVTVGINT